MPPGKFTRCSELETFCWKQFPKISHCTEGVLFAREGSQRKSPRSATCRLSSYLAPPPRLKARRVRFGLFPSLDSCEKPMPPAMNGRNFRSLFFSMYRKPNENWSKSELNAFE